MFRRLLIVVAIALLSGAATAGSPETDADQASRKPEPRPDASTLKPEESPVRVESDGVKLPDKQFDLPPEQDPEQQPPPKKKKKQN